MNTKSAVWRAQATFAQPHHPTVNQFFAFKFTRSGIVVGCLWRET